MDAQKYDVRMPVCVGVGVYVCGGVCMCVGACVCVWGLYVCGSL